MSADLYNDCCIRLAMKNYLNMTPHMFKSGKCIKSYSKFNFHLGNKDVMINSPKICVISEYPLCVAVSAAAAGGAKRKQFRI